MADTTRTARTFVELAQALVDPFDLIDFLHWLCQRTVDVLAVTEAGVVLADRHANLRPLASSSERMRLLELIEIQSQDGPCLDAFNDRTAIRADDLAAEVDRWPQFTPAALDVGFRSAYALPMRQGDSYIGALNIFGDTTSALPDEDQVIGQALADVATIGILQERLGRQQELLTDQIDTALHHRVVLEQAKGIVAEQIGASVDEAFTLLRDHARATGRLLHDVLGDITERRIDGADLTSVAADHQH